MKRRLSKTIHPLLAVMLLIVGMAPPAVGHRHAAGHLPHTLQTGEQRVFHSHEHGHEHHHDATHEHHSLGASWHLHFAWFGVEVTLPPADSSPESRPDPDNAALVALVNDSYTASAVSPDLAGPDSEQPLLAPVKSVSNMSLTEMLRRSNLGRHESLLCDTARFERSGVLLI